MRLMNLEYIHFFKKKTILHDRRDFFTEKYLKAERTLSQNYYNLFSKLLQFYILMYILKKNSNIFAFISHIEALL